MLSIDQPDGDTISSKHLSFQNHFIAQNFIACLAMFLLHKLTLFIVLSFVLSCTYIDIKSAFDSVDRVALWKALRGSGMPPFLLQLIHDLHTGTTARVRTS